MKKTVYMITTALAAVAARGFAADDLPVVVIETDNGPVRINECDYDPEKHTLATGETAPAPAPASPPTADQSENAPVAPAPDTDGAPPTADQSENTQQVAPPPPPPAAPAAPAQDGDSTPPPPPPAPVVRSVKKEGRGATAKFYVVDDKGEKVAGFADKGYAAEAEAWDAIKAAPSQ